MTRALLGGEKTGLNLTDRAKGGEALGYHPRPRVSRRFE